MIRRLLTLLLLAPFAWGSAGTQPSDDPPPAFNSAEHELAWIEGVLEEKRAAKRRHLGRAKYYDREAQRLLFKDYGYARLYYSRAARAREKALQIDDEIRSLEERREELMNR